MSRRLLAVLAHPDDETFGCGGTLAKYASEGTRVALVCATRGEVGQISDPALATPVNIGRVREGELREACRVLGISDLFMLDYRDSGMPGAEDNHHAQALSMADAGALAGQVAEIITNFKPQVVLTFDPSGGYGHPDHIAIHHAARSAFLASRKGATEAEGRGKSDRPSKLYYIGIPRSLFREFQATIREKEIESDFGEMDPDRMGVPDEELTTELDVSQYRDLKAGAARCHRTQVVDGDPFSWLPESLRDRFLSREYLVRAEPPFVVGRDARERDLFDGL